MFKGLLRVKGTIDLNQFWPTKQSDADTVKVTVSPNGFEFSPDPKHKPFRTTHVFDHATVKGAVTKAVLSTGVVTIRAEHIDACELHYQAPLPKTKDYRQYFGETATTKLHDLLARTNEQPVPCEVRTVIDHPNDVFDTYGRLIGEIFIRLNGEEINVNRWLVQNGWAFPAFYNSALPSEVTDFSACAVQAQAANAGIWKYLSNDVGHPTFSLLFRPHGDPDQVADRGPEVIPKIFRRQVQWHVSLIDNLFTGEFREFLATLKNDGWVETSDFLQNPKIKVPKQNHNLSRLVDDEGMFGLGPADLVFFEKSSSLVDEKEKKITAWWAGPAKVVPTKAKAAAA